MLEQVIDVLKKMNEKEQAISLLKTFMKHAYVIEEFDILAKKFFELKCYHEAIECAEKILSLTKDDGVVFSTISNLINVNNHRNYPEVTMKYINQLELVAPLTLDLLMEKSYAHFLLNQKDEAENILQRLLTEFNLDKETETKIRFNLGTYYMYRDKFQEGLEAFLVHGKHVNTWKNYTLPFEFWDGEDEHGRTIILMAEAGIGDEIVNVRFMKHLQEIGMHPIWLTERKDLAEVFNRNGFYTITSLKDIPEQVKEPLWTYPMQIPIHMKLEYKDLYDGPYLQASDEYNQKWKEKMTGDKLKIGLRWSGNPDYDQDLHRTVPIYTLYETLKNFDVDFYSLQKEFQCGIPEIKDIADELETWEDTMGCMENLDIIITSCTSVAHMAAAMGKKVFIFVSISSYYTWCHSMEKSPWYGDNVTILRQTKPRVWTEPIYQLKNILNTSIK